MIEKTLMFGALPSPYDPRDYSVRMVRAVSYPESYRLPDVDIYDQGSIGNCVMQALRAAVHNHVGAEQGATFGYGRWRSHMQEGMYPSEAANGLIKDGIPSVKDDNQFLPMPEAADYAVRNASRLLPLAAKNIGWTWARVRTVDEIKAALMQGVRCMVCLPYIGINGGRWRVDGYASAHHEMLITGWDKAGWIVRNSWGIQGSGILGGTKDGYVTVAINDIFACDDVIALFPPAQKEDEPVVVRRTLRLKDPYMRGDDVAEYQTKVKAHGFDPGMIDGVYGKNGEKAAKAFQKAKNLVADGIVGAKTWAALDKSPDDGGKYDVTAIESIMRLTLGGQYIIGAQGHELTQAYLDKRYAAKPGYFTNGRYEWMVRQIELASQMGKKLYAYDCSGLLMACNDVLHFWTTADLSAEGIRKRCKKINRSEVRPGDIAFRVDDGEAHHMGWVGESGLYEAVGTEYGVQCHRNIDSREVVNMRNGNVEVKSSWNEWGRPI